MLALCWQDCFLAYGRHSPPFFLHLVASEMQGIWGTVVCSHCLEKHSKRPCTPQLLDYSWEGLSDDSEKGNGVLLKNGSAKGLYKQAVFLTRASTGKSLPLVLFISPFRQFSQLAIRSEFCLENESKYFWCPRPKVTTTHLSSVPFPNPP